MAEPRCLPEDTLCAVLDQLKCAADIKCFKRCAPQLQRAFITTADTVTSQVKPKSEVQHQQ
jgi:hypothetical protein